MTAVLEPVALLPGTAGTGVACPPWCDSDPDWHDPEVVTLHDGLGADLPTTARPSLGPRHRGAPDNIHVAAEASSNGQPVVWLVGCRGGTPAEHGHYATVDEAEAIGRHLLDMVAQLRGSKPARDLQIGDRIVLDGKAHEVVFLMIDACYHDVPVRCCDGHVQIFTDLSEAVDESTPADILDPGDLVQIEVKP
ncbi:hypothetical protein [Dactylosporangium sp. NPDC051484]|uniref:hypothetical protein n=1 Tax=Dactylosporangium sp. NPDC051484 TaxID=3154942 RepID=UPI00344C8004